MENEADNRKYPGNLLRVCLDKWSNHEFSGIIYNNCIKTPIPFSDYADFLLRGEALFDSMAFPQAFEESRHFGTSEKQRPSYNWLNRPEGMSDLQISAQTGRAATFNVLVETRRKADWQGILQSSDGNFISEFSSTIELEALLDDFRREPASMQ